MNKILYKKFPYRHSPGVHRALGHDEPRELSLGRLPRRLAPVGRVGEEHLKGITNLFDQTHMSFLRGSAENIQQTFDQLNHRGLNIN